ncbi:MAG: type II CRISPR-associated endonuclease Cas1 [Balneolia bacterium]|nr:type II CRISPR-associated endonuclease Cas1 [Balneolia bacterium]
MIKKTLFFQNPCHLSIKLNQLVISLKETGEVVQRPAEDLGFVVLDHHQITFSMAVMQHFAMNNTAVIFCDARHHPASMMMHLETHQTQSRLYQVQAAAGLPLKKKLWKQTIKQKLRNQGGVLDVSGQQGEPLRYLAKKVKSGDSTNCEARGARTYWPSLFGLAFRRQRFGSPPNHMLNYGYAILRAATARALMGSGLLPALGIHHKNKYNAFCLADDIMEPYRPFVDLHVSELHDSGLHADELTIEHKKELLQLLTSDVSISGKTRPLMMALSETTASLSRCFTGEQKKIAYPVL